MGKTHSSLVQAVIALDEQFANLIQLGTRIDTLNLKSQADFDQIDRLIEHFNNVAIGVSEHIGTMSLALNAARAQAEQAAQLVAQKADEYSARKIEIQTKMEEFRALGEKVGRLSSSLSGLQPPAGHDVTDEDRAKITARISAVESELRPLIEEAAALKHVGQQAKIKLLEQSADAMWQSLNAVSQKISTVV